MIATGNRIALSYSAHMKLGFEESQTTYTSGTQKARAWTEAWVGAQAYCPNCGHAKMAQFPNNSPLADFFCTSCSEEFELKSQKKTFGARVADGAYGTKCERLAACNNPNLLLMNYDPGSRSVINLFIVPKHFFIRDIIEQRKPLAPSLEKRKRRVVRRYRERADFLLVAVVGPDAFSAECVGELREPLGHERSRWRVRSART